MAKVKIVLEKGETKEQAEELLFKSLSLHRSGDSHREDFTEPAMQVASEKASKIHEDIFLDMLREIGEILDEEYSDGNI